MDYAHARHAGNAGDVFKHVALVALLEEAGRDPAPLTYVETHAGDGLFPLGSAGEWGAGVQLLWNATDGLAGRYAKLVRGFSGPGATRPGTYPGSPLIAAKLLGPRDRMILHEIDPQAASVLKRALAGDARAEVRESDGLAVLQKTVRSGKMLVLVDPPYTQKQEWTDSAQAVARAALAAPSAAIALWYPIKALTRPRGLLAELAKLSVHGLAVELHWTPLRLKRERLNGSGLVLVNVPRQAQREICAALPDLGPLLQTHGEWSGTEIGF